jgi:Protein of unknown function (DUF5131)
MSENSKIEWTDHTFNPWEGCQKVGPGCDHCYAEARNARFSGGTAIDWGPGAPRRRTPPANWRKPLQWNAAHAEFFAKYGRRQRVFCASLADVFDDAVPDEWRIDLASMIVMTPNLDWLLLTKRIGNAASMLAAMFALFILLSAGCFALGLRGRGPDGANDRRDRSDCLCPAVSRRTIAGRIAKEPAHEYAPDQTDTKWRQPRENSHA